MPVFSPLERPCDVGGSVAEEELSVLGLPVLELAAEEEVWLVIVGDGEGMEVELKSEVLGRVVVIVELEVGSADVEGDDSVVEAICKFVAEPATVM
jgi:hypothetical protein